MDDQPKNESSIKNGFLNKRPGNPKNELHRAIDSLTLEINDGSFKKGNEKNSAGSSKVKVVPEEIKGKKLKELTITELGEAEDMQANEDRFRHRFTEDDLKRDVENAKMYSNASIRWLD